MTSEPKATLLSLPIRITINLHITRGIVAKYHSNQIHAICLSSLLLVPFQGLSCLTQAFTRPLRIMQHSNSNPT